MDLRPSRLVRGLESLARWREAGVVVVPIRHHSPGCSAALTHLLEEVRPTTVLIEGPHEYTSLVGVLADERTVPPIAVLSVADDRSSFYPLAEFSPEWVALRWGVRHGADVAFIDRSWDADADPGNSAEGEDEPPPTRLVTLQAERHLAHSRAIARLASRLGCRDHDEVWEHLFEMRSRSEFSAWRTYLEGVLGWAALARLEADREQLDADGTHAREAVMVALLERHRRESAGPIVVITGAFHTLGLLEALDGTAEGRWITDHDPELAGEGRDSWLIRYDDARMDALREYGAGMPAPGFWQRAWREDPAADGGRALVMGVLLDVAALVRTEGDLLSSAVLIAATDHALALAALRGRAWPGRTDVLDAMLSCFVKDEAGFSGALGRAIDEVFTGRGLGQLPPGVAAPPLVAEVREQAQRLRFQVSDSTVRTVRLDTARTSAHVRRREFLATMRFIGSGFARQVGGADIVRGRGLDRLTEEWEYAWTPLVESALVDAAARGATLQDVRRSVMAERLGAENPTAAEVATLIAEMVTMGAADDLGPALRVLRECFESDSSLGSLVSALAHLIALVTEHGRRSLAPSAAEVMSAVETGLVAVSYRVGPLKDVGEEDGDQATSDVLALHDLLERLSEPDLAQRVASDGVRGELARLRSARTASAQLHGCLVALGHLDGVVSAEQLRAEVERHLHPAAEPERLAGFLLGLMRAAPDLLVHDDQVLRAASQRVESMEEDAFLRILPDLRRAFTLLRPSDTAAVASAIAAMIGVQATDLDAVLSFDPALAARARDLERALASSLERDHLTLELLGEQP